MYLFRAYLKALKVRALVPWDAGWAVPLSQLSLCRAGGIGADYECSEFVPQWFKNKLHWEVPKECCQQWAPLAVSQPEQRGAACCRNLSLCKRQHRS